jgi:predicted nucleic acid-binding protein
MFDGFDLHEGELAALHLAKSVNADLVVIDEIESRSAARSLGLAVIGTLGVLELADVRGLVNFPAAVDRLQATSFRVSPHLVSEFLTRHRARRLGK